MKKSVLFFIFFLHIFSTSYSQYTMNTSFSAHWGTYGRCNELAFHGDHVYLASALHLMIIDVSDPNLLVELGSIGFSGTIAEISIMNSIAFVLESHSGIHIYGDGGLYAVDISNPKSPQHISGISTEAMNSDLFIDGGYAYVCCGSNGMKIFDISDPSNLSFVSNYNPQDKSYYRFDFKAPYIYLTNNNGIEVVDISNPELPVYANFFEFERARGITINDDLAFVFNEFSLLKVLNIIDPMNISEIGNYNDLTIINNIFISGDKAYVASGNLGLTLLDVGDPANISSISSINTPGPTIDVINAGSFSYLADGYGGFRIVNTANPQSPYETGFIDMEDRVFDIKIQDHFAYISVYDSGFRILDIRDAKAPVLAGYLNTAHPVMLIDIYGDFAFLAEEGFGLRIVDISDANSPVYVGSFSCQNAYGIKVKDNYAYLTTGDLGELIVIDIDDPANPVETARVAGMGDILSEICLQGNYAYAVSGYSSGLSIFDIGNPNAPMLIGSFETSLYNRFFDVDVAGNYAYIAGNHPGLMILDISDPTNPIEVGSLDSNAPNYEINVKGNLAYLTGYRIGLKIMDISNPEIPEEVGFYDAGIINTGAVALSGDKVFICAWNAGLMVIKNELITSTEEIIQASSSIVSVYPNPFTDRITFDFTIEENTNTTLEIFNTNGQIVSTLFNGILQKGNHELTFDAAHLPSGIYTYRLQTGNELFFGKLLSL